MTKKLIWHVAAGFMPAFKHHHRISPGGRWQTPQDCATIWRPSRCWSLRALPACWASAYCAHPASRNRNTEALRFIFAFLLSRCLFFRVQDELSRRQTHDDFQPRWTAIPALDRSPARLDASSDDRQAQARAAGSPVARIVEPVKGSKDFVQCIFRNSWAGVSHDDLDLLLLAG